MGDPKKKFITMSSARLFAVQAVYQMVENESNAAEVVHDFMDNRIAHILMMEKDLAEPDREYFSQIVTGVENREKDLLLILDGSLKAHSEGSQIEKMKQNEPLLYAVMICGAYEMLAHHEIEAPIIINDYLNIGHAFFDGGEVKLLNGTLDKISKSVRD